jgi:hypothetical protein
MDVGSRAAQLLEVEARGLISRLDVVKPFVVHETMVLAAALPYDAWLRIERFLHDGRERLRARVHEFIRWLRGDGRAAPAPEQQRRFVLIRLEFNDVLSQFDLFTEVVTQRSENEIGVWLSGLDVLAADALKVDVEGTRRVPVVCYLARGAGAAIRRANTRLPGGRPNPVAIIRVPRERMVGSGIASSLIHEVGHQGAAQLGLVESLRAQLQGAAAADPNGQWQVYDSWISEIVADCWSVGMLGITGTVGLLAVVSLPPYFVFRPTGGDPHPMPYLRVLISAGIGEALYPHPQWHAMRQTWKRLYPVEQLPVERRSDIAAFESTITRFVELLLNHRSSGLRGRRLGDIWPVDERRPERLLGQFEEWGGDLGVMARQSPTLVFAVLGQAKVEGVIAPETESRLLRALLSAWAVRSSLDVVQARSAAAHRIRRPAMKIS